MLSASVCLQKLGYMNELSYNDYKLSLSNRIVLQSFTDEECFFLTYKTNKLAVVGQSASN